MKPVHSFVVTSHLPKRIEKLREIAYNYWWCWNSEAKELFIRMDRKLWEDVNHNPVLLINRLNQKRLKELSEQPDFTSYMEYIYDKFNKYMESKGWFESLDVKTKGTIGYFSTEYGINESFPNYSGGLGVLSGDHLKSASDLHLPLIGVGLLYQQGYFRQHLTQNGWQNEIYLFNDFFSMPIVLMKEKSGEPIIIDVDLPLGKAYAQIWKLQLGKVPLYLLDTNIDKNEIEEYRDITDQLYGGTRDTRIQQEIVLGIGGVRALRALGIYPEIFHINEGHAAFALLERSRLNMEKYNIDFKASKQLTIATSVFTTHTPVPAGNEAFSVERIEYYLSNYYKSLGLSKEDFFALGQVGHFNQNEKFSMTVLGLNMSAYHNGVSKLHGVVSRNMWKDLWKCFPVDEVPIDSITNGIHTMTWVAREFSELFDRYLSPRWRTDIDNSEIWQKIDTIPSEELWREKQRRRVRLVLFAREYLIKRQKGFLTPEQINKINEYLDPDALTIGFARRFATYKRATLLFTDMDRLTNILKKYDRPVQIIIAGKAHPHDVQGKEVIQSIINKVRQWGLERHVVFLEDYDMVISRFMVKGCDVWLNTPVRPMEASGTSGMKAALNGTLNLSILDGWFDEAFDGENGFAIGHGEDYANVEEQNIIESGALYDLLETVIVPLFYERTNVGRIPDKWVTYMKNCMKTLGWNFSTTRMLKEYANKYYIPAMSGYKLLSSNNAENTVKLREWKKFIHEQWSDVEIIDVFTKEEEDVYVGKSIRVSARLSLGKLSANDVNVQVYYGSINHLGEMSNTNFKNLDLIKSEDYVHLYEGEYVCNDTGKQGFTIRVLPTNPLLTNASLMNLCVWAGK